MTTEGWVGAPSPVSAIVDKALAITGEETDVVEASELVVGSSASMQELHALIQKAAAGSATVLIRGESGTGKEIAARAIHQRGPRRRMPFVKIQCGALPDSLLESELFGYERGAFTGAMARKPGRVELAQGGTLFLDEIGDITPAMQVKLLRLLQDREFERLGGNTTLKVDVRFIAATHRDLESLMKLGEFREDIFYRLAVIPIWIAPLRTRREDIEQLARYFCKRFAEIHERPGLEMTDPALKLLRRQRWPGNVRQLQNFVERLVVLADGKVIDEADISRESSSPASFSTQTTSTESEAPPEPQDNVKALEQRRREAERKALLQALDRAQGNRTIAARMLGVCRRTLYNLLEAHGVA
jgi:two-component system response regulator AtoC